MLLNERATANQCDYKEVKKSGSEMWNINTVARVRQQTNLHMPKWWHGRILTCTNL